MSIGRLSCTLLLFGGLSVGDARAEEQTAAIPLMIYAGSSHAAQLRVRRVTEETAEAVDARTLPDLLAGGSPYLVGVEDQSRCADSPSTNEQVLRQVVDAHEMRVNMNLTGASDLLKAAAESLGCLSQPVESTTGARVHFVLGILHFAGGDQTAARGAFDRALSFRPDLAWDDDFAPDARPLFDAARATAGQRSSAMLRLVAGSVDQVRIDGQVPAEQDGIIDVSAGTHIVQVIGESVHTLVVDLPNDTATWLVIPAAVDDALIDVVLTSEGRAALEGLLHGSSVGQREVVFIAHPSGTWRYDPQGRTWKRQQVDLARSVRTPLIIGGGVGVVLGGVLMAVHSSKANQLASGVKSDQAGTNPTLNTTDHQDRQAQWKRARTGYWVGTGIGATGLVAAAVGGALFLNAHPGPVRLMAAPLPGGGALHLQFSPVVRSASRRRTP